MSTLQPFALPRLSKPMTALDAIAVPSLTSSVESRHLFEKLIRMRSPSPASEGSLPRSHETVEAQLFDARAQFKIYVSQIAMHLESNWRERLFAQLDSLLDAEQWEDGDLPPTLDSFRTFMRLMLLLKPNNRPGLGASSSGWLIAAWSVGGARLTIECLPKDQIRWSLVRTIDEDRVRAAGVDTLSRLQSVLKPYMPELWFGDGE